jgi:hypothetical protein
VFEERIREIAREVFAEEWAKTRGDRPDDPLTGAQVRLVHARRSAAGVSPDELKALLADRYQVASLTELSQVRLDELLELLAAKGLAGKGV